MTAVDICFRIFVELPRAVLHEHDRIDLMYLGIVDDIIRDFFICSAGCFIIFADQAIAIPLLLIWLLSVMGMPFTFGHLHVRKHRLKRGLFRGAHIDSKTNFPGSIQKMTDSFLSTHPTSERINYNNCGSGQSRIS